MSTIVIDKRALQATALASAVLIFKFVITLGIQVSLRRFFESPPDESSSSENLGLLTCREAQE